MGGVRAALVVDRDAEAREIIRTVLEERGLMTLGAASAAEAIEHLHGSEVRLVFLELDIPPHALETLIGRANEHHPVPLLIGMSEGRGEGAGGTVPYGSLFDILHKPLDETMVRFRAERAMERLALLAEERRLREELKKKLGLHGLVGHSSAIERLRDRLADLARSDGCVWFTGEEGTGKRFAARILHESSRRARHPFTAIDCRAIEKLPSIDGEGTLYLDHPAALSPVQQRALLLRLNSMTQAHKRILAGSRQEPIAEVKLGRLLPELHAALAESSVHLPPLRDRANDVSLLARHFMETIAEINRLPPIEISSESLVVLDRYSWPGNVRELRDCIEKAVILAVDGKIRPHDLPQRMRRESSSDWLLEDSERVSARKFREAKRSVVDFFEKDYLIDLMGCFEGNVTLASKHAGMLRSALQRLLRKHDIKSADFRKKKPPRAGGRQVKTVVD